MLKMKGVADKATATEATATEATATKADATEATATEATATEAGPATAPAVAERSSHRHRRLALKGGIAASVVIALVVFAGVPQKSGGVTRADATPEAPAADAETGTTAPAMTLDAVGGLEAKLVELRTAAVAFRASNGSYDGFAAPGALVATSTDTAAMSVAIGDACGFIAVFRGEVGEPQVDPSWSACDSAFVDETGVAARVIDLVAAGFDWSVANVDIYGRRSLTGFAPVAPGATLIATSPDGAWAQVAVEHGGSCVVVVIVPRATDADPLAPAEQAACPPAG